MYIASEIEERRKFAQLLSVACPTGTLPVAHLGLQVQDIISVFLVLIILLLKGSAE